MITILTNIMFALGIGISYALTGISDIVFPFSKRNYKHNAPNTFHGFIHDQTCGDFTQLKMGYKSCSFNGCGCAAAYNAALLKGTVLSPADIVKYYEKHGGIVLDGLWGVNPLVVRGFFRSIGFSAVIRNFPKNMDKLIASTGISVLAFAHKRGMHFVAVEYKDGAFRVYNEYSGCRSFCTYPSVEAWLKNAGCMAISLILLG